MTSRALKKFLDPKDIETGISEVVALAKHDRIQIALAGGVAMQLLGSDRLTTDVDFIAAGVPDGLTLKRTLSFGGVAALSPAGVPVDVIVRDDDYSDLYEDALNTAVLDPELDVKVVLPEYLIAMKLAASRQKDEQDIMKVIEEETIDLDKVRVIIREYLGKFAVGAFNSFVDEVAWQKSRSQ